MFLTNDAVDRLLSINKQFCVTDDRYTFKQMKKTRNSFVDNIVSIGKSTSEKHFPRDIKNEILSTY